MKKQRARVYQLAQYDIRRDPSNKRRRTNDEAAPGERATKKSPQEETNLAGGLAKVLVLAERGRISEHP